MDLLLIIIYVQIIYSKTERVIPSSEFIIRFEIATIPIQPISLNDKNLSKRLETICALALERSLAKHLFGNDEKMDAVEALNDWRWWWWSSTLAGNNKTTNIRENEEKEQKNSEDKAVENSKLEMAAESSFEELKSSSKRQFRVRVIGIDKPKPWRRTFILAFAVYLQERAIPAEVMVRDLSLLSLAEISAYLQLAVLRIDALVNKEMIEQTQWWLIGIIIGTGILIIGCCWAILFFWLNICVRREIPPQIDKGIEEARVGSERSEEVVEQPSAPPLILPSQKVGETENISTITSRVSGKQNVCEDDLLLKTSSKTKQSLKENIIKNKSNTLIIKRRLPKILLKRKSLPKSWRSSQKRKIKIEEEKVVNSTISKQQEIKENKDEAKAIEASLQPLPPPIELEEACQAIKQINNKNNQQIPYQFIQNYNKEQQKQYKINNRLRPYWVADKLESIFGIYNSSKENPRPAPPSDYGEVKIVGII
ncbi:hypothetical protein ACQ4LE_010448 [Meloidogyne hapla]